jgi:hypothetical protein
MKKSVAKEIVDILKQSGKIAAEYTGKVLITVDISQGGVNNAHLLINEKLN